MNDKIDRILNGNLLKVLIFLSFPIMLNTFVVSLYNLIDAIFVANIGENEVSSIVFVGTVKNLIYGIPQGISIATTTLVARYVGISDLDTAKKYAGNALSISFIVSIVIAIVGALFSREILVTFSSTDDVISIVHIGNMYFKTTLLISPLLFFNLVYFAIKNAKGDTKVSMMLNILLIIIKIIINYVLIIIFDKGLLSLVFATFIANFIVAIYGIYDLFYEEKLLKLNLSFMKVSKSVSKIILLVGIPVVLERMSVSYGFVSINNQVLAFGESALTGYGVANRINSLIFGIVGSVGTGLSIIISQNLSNGNVGRCKEAIKKAFIFNIILSLSLFCIVYISRFSIINLFKFDSSSLAYYHTLNAMSIFTISVVFWAIFQIVMGIFKGTGYTKYTLYISLVRIYLLRLPLAWLFVNVFMPHANEFGIWYSVLTSNALTALLSLAIYFFKKDILKLYKQ